MPDPGTHHHIEIKEGEQTVAAADVTIPPEADTAQAALRTAPGHIPPGRRYERPARRRHPRSAPRCPGSAARPVS